MATINTSPTFYLTIAGVPMSTPGWRIQNLPDLVRGPDFRGDDVLVPLLAGRRPKRRRADVTKLTIQMEIWGDFDREGNAYTNAIVGAITNVNYLRANCFDPVDTGDGTRACKIVLPDATDLDAPAHCGPLIVNMISPGRYRATADLSLPGGSFV